MNPNRSNLIRILQRLRDDDGAAAVSFIMTFPLFLLIVAIIVQLGLIVNAKLMVSHAADTAARSAMTNLPEDNPENVRRAAWMSLAPICPEAQVAPASEAAGLVEALQHTGAEIADSFVNRYTYAKEATDVSWNPDRNFISSQGNTVNVELTYKFRLTVPFAMRLVSAQELSVAGISGRFWEVSAHRKVQVSHGRKARLDNDFWSR